MTDYPKILFIADEIPQSINAGSIQFFRLFENYPVEKLLIIGRAPANGAKTLGCHYHTLKFDLLDKIRTSRFSSYLTNLQSLGIFLPSLPKSLERIADEFKPDVIISLMQLISFYYPAYKYSKDRKIPLILFCHDDAEDFARPSQFFRNRLTKLNAKIYRSAKKRICISPEMVAAWKRKYNLDGEYLYPISSSSIVPKKLDKTSALVKKNHLTIGYAGSLSYGYREGILEILPVLEKTNSILRIYRDSDNHISNSSIIEFAGYAETPEETWKRIIIECDVVILPYSNQKRFENLYSTHFPSKLSEYVSLQMPVVIFGPSYATGVKYGLSKNRIIATINIGQLEKALLELYLDMNERRYYSETHKEIIDFDSNQIFSSFYKTLSQISG